MRLQGEGEISKLDPVSKTCIPRDDVREGNLTDAHFAAQLDKIVRDPGSYPVYGDPEQFFELTYPTSGLRLLLTRVFGRLSGAKGENADHGVVRSETSFGGGKTHGLIATYHLAKGARPSNLEEFIDPSILPEDCRIAAVVADALDPVAGLETNGHLTHTIWGEIGAQLGSEAYEVLKENDLERSAPGTNTWRKALAGDPTIIVIDELAAYLRTLVSAGSEDVRRMAKAIPAFLKSLYEVAAADSNVVVVITFASTQNAFGPETGDLEQLMDESAGHLQSTLEETQDVTNRVGSIVKPAEDNEIGEILKRRLFNQIDEESAEQAGLAYRDLYQGLLEKDEPLSGGADQPVSYGEHVTRSYPFHPELIRVLDKRLGSIPKFQRARGSLRLLAETVASIYSGDLEAPEIINLADIDLGNSEIRNALTTALDKAAFDQVATADIAGSESHASQVDKSRFEGRKPYATRAGRTVFIHSLEAAGQTGAGAADWTLGTVATKDSPQVVEEALRELSKIAWYLSEEPGGRWRFVTEEQPAKIIASQAKNVPNSAVRSELDSRIEKIFSSDASVSAIHYPSTLSEVPDRETLRLVVLHQDDVSVTSRDASPPPSKLVEYLEKAGASGAARTYRNSVLFLVADSEATETMMERIRQTIALEQIVDDSSKMSSYNESVAKKLRKMADEVQMETRIAITRCYKHLYYPTADKANGNLRHLELSPASQGAQSTSHTSEVITELKTQNKIRETAIPTDLIRSKTWPKGEPSVTTANVLNWFWRDHGAPILLDVAILRESIRNGVKNGEWVVYDAQAEKTSTAEDPPASIEFSQEQMLYDPGTAENEGLTGRSPRLEDITNCLNQNPSLAGDELRAALEIETKKEPTKGQVTDLLARGAEGGELAKLAVVFGKPESGAKAASPSDIRRGSLSAMTILSAEEAGRLSLELPGRITRVRDAQATGSAGVAFGSVVDQVNDSSATLIKRLVVQAKADPGEGTRDIKLLGSAVSRFPKHEITVSLSLAMDFDQLRPSPEIELNGPASAYQKIEDSIIALGNKATECQGQLSLEFDLGDGISPDSNDISSIRKAITELDPGEVTVTAVLG